MEDEAIKKIEGITGWFSVDEARILYRLTAAAVARLPKGCVVEIGSLYGRSTIILGSAAEEGRPGAKVHAIDPHEGDLSGAKIDPTWDTFFKNIVSAGLDRIVIPIRNRSVDVQWTGAEISVLFIDGLHDSKNVKMDYDHFYKYVPVGGLIAFHDYSNKDYPDVREFVDKKIKDGELVVEGVPPVQDQNNTLIITRKRPRLSIITPSCGRPTLQQTLESMVAGGVRIFDDVMVIGDGPQPVAKAIVESFPKDLLFIRYFEVGPTRATGGVQRNFGMDRAIGTHLAFIDDDDKYVAGAIDEVRLEIEKNPGRVLIFKEQSRTIRHLWGIVWKEQKVELGNVGTQGVIAPNVSERLGRWTNQYWSDYDFIRSTVDLYPDKDAGVVWVDRIIAHLY